MLKRDSFAISSPLLNPTQLLHSQIAVVKLTDIRPIEETIFLEEF